MLHAFRTFVLLYLCGAGLVACTSAPSFTRDELFITRSSAKPPADVHQAIRDYVKQKNWLYVGDNKLKGGEVTQVRICIAQVAGAIWSAGMHVSAMMPCGHMSIYREGNVTRLTLLHPQYLTLLDPHPAVRQLALDTAGPFLTMLDQITR